MINTKILLILFPYCYLGWAWKDSTIFVQMILQCWGKTCSNSVILCFFYIYKKAMDTKVYLTCGKCLFSVLTLSHLWEIAESNNEEKMRVSVTDRPAKAPSRSISSVSGRFPHCLSQEDDPCFTLHGRFSFLWLICHKLMISRHPCCRSEGMLREREPDNFSISHLNF